MDRLFLSYYEAELQFLRDLGGKSPKAPKGVPGRPGTEASAWAAPYVERLLEGVAFLTARVRLKQDAEFDRFTDHMLELLFPDYLAPTPALALVQFRPERQAADLAGGYKVPRGARLAGKLGAQLQT